MKAVLVISVMATVFVRCNKSEENQLGCDDLKRSLLTEDLAATTKPLSGDLTEYSKQGLEKLAVNINSQCGYLVVSLDCFNCIYTLPPQSEVSVAIKTNDSTVTKLIDLSASSDRQMKIIRIYQ